MNPFSLRSLTLVGASLLGSWALPAQAATFTVSNLADSGEGSLRAAILAANSAPDADTIVFASGLRGTVVLSSGELPITSDLTITGPGTNVLAVSGNNTSRLFNVSGGRVAISGLTLTNGRVVGVNGGNGEGGAIYNAGTLALTNIVLSQNTAVGWSDRSPGTFGTGSKGSDGRGGAIYNVGALSLLQTRLQGNSAVGGNGQSKSPFPYIFTPGPGGNASGGAIYNTGLLRLGDATFANNTAVGGSQGSGIDLGDRGKGSAEYPDVRSGSVLLESVKVSAKAGEQDRSPFNASDKVGAKRTFSVTVNNADGVTDIKEVWLLLNKQLSWNAGATLIYVPGATTPTKGQLFLRSGDAFLSPVDIGVGSLAVLDNSAVSVVAREVSVTTTGNSLTLNLPLSIRDGLVGANQVFARVTDKVGATDPAAAPSDNGYRRFGKYTVTPQFKGATNSVPTLSRLQPSTTNTLLPSMGLGPIQNFAFSAFDADGTGDIESVWFVAGKSSNWTNSVTFVYTPQTRRLVLRSDDGQRFLGGGAIGSAGIIENSQVRVDLSKVRVSAGGDGKTLTVVLPLQAKTGLVGQNKVYLRVQDLARATAPNGDAQGYVQSGAWNVGQSTSTTAASAPSAGGS